MIDRVHKVSDNITQGRMRTGGIKEKKKKKWEMAESLEKVKFEIIHLFVDERGCKFLDQKFFFY